MKKTLSGFAFGLTLAIAIPVWASGVVGMKVDTTYPVVIGEYRLSKDAVSIEGTSYLPVRVMAETVGYNVYFEQNKVILKRKVGQAVVIPREGNIIGPDGTETSPPLQMPKLPEGNYFISNGVTGIRINQINGDGFRYKVVNGEGYLQWEAFLPYSASSKGDIVWVSVSYWSKDPENEIEIKFDKNNIDNDTVIKDGDLYLVKLSTLGLKASIITRGAGRKEHEVVQLENI